MLVNRTWIFRVILEIGAYVLSTLLHLKRSREMLLWQLSRPFQHYQPIEHQGKLLTQDCLIGGLYRHHHSMLDKKKEREKEQKDERQTDVTADPFGALYEKRLTLSVPDFRRFNSIPRHAMGVTSRACQRKLFTWVILLLHNCWI